MPAHPIDFEIQAGLYATPELAAIFDEKTRFGRWLQIEAALAEAQGELGLIPAPAAAAIAAHASLEKIDLAFVAAAYGGSRNSLVPLLQGLQKVCGPEHGGYVHFGITTQDVLDTAGVLEQQETLGVIGRDLKRLEELLCDLARTHRATPMIGRTHGQQAMPITFGLKVSTWAAEVHRHRERLAALKPKTAVLQLGGAVGTMAALGPRALEVAERTAARLGLATLLPAWHTTRDIVGETAAFYGLVGSTLEKIGSEIVQLAKTEIGEVAETAPGRAPSSSTMPHKNNPVDSQRIAVLARHARALVPVVLEAMVHEHERDPRALWSEWLAVPQLAIYTGTALHLLITVLENLEIRTGRMRENLYRQKDLVVSEWLLFTLARKKGKSWARKKVETLLATASERQTPLQEILRQDPETGPLIAKEKLECFEKPELYCGLATAIVDRTLQDIAPRQQNEPENQ
jgi:3-carboxy-cis,cis-muconate cycloisomerase